MKLKNVKVGARVMLKEDLNVHLHEGAIGTIQEDKELHPYVKWDNFENGIERDRTIWAVHIDYLKRIK